MNARRIVLECALFIVALWTAAILFLAAVYGLAQVLIWIFP